MLKGLIKFLLVMALGLLLGLLGVEAIVRAFIYRGQVAASWSDRPKFYYATEQTDTLQDYRYKKTKSEDVFRIAVVGDSFSFAPFMQFTDAFPKQLERMLNLNGGDRRSEIINLGVPAYSSSHEVDLVRKAIEHNSDLIILQITLNDPELKPYRPTGIRQDLPDQFGAFNASNSSSGILKYWKTAAFVAERLHNTKTHRAYIDYFNNLFANKRGYKVYSESLKEMVSLARANDIKIVGVVFPLFGLPIDEQYPFYEIHQLAAKPLVDEGVAVLDLLELYKGIPLERLQVIPGGDRHPNEIAHRMAAESIYEWLLKLDLIPEELRIKKLFKTRIGTINQKEFQF